MPRVHRVTDCNDANGCVTLTLPNSNVYANNLLIAIDGSFGTSHAPCPLPSPPHCAGNWTTANGGPTVFVHNTPVNSAGDPDTCGHVRVEGSPTVFTDGNGGGAVYDNSEPLTSAPIVTLGDGRKYVPTEQDEYVFENTDVPEEINLGPETVFPSTEVKPVIEKEQDLVQPSPTTPPAQNCSNVNTLDSNFSWANGSPAYIDFDDFSSSFQLSPSYYVSDLTTDPIVSTYSFSSSVTQTSGLTQKQILQNLCFLSRTILQPLRDDPNVPTFAITSGFRNKSGGSQHNKGQAVDIQVFSFHGLSSTGRLYYELAQYIRDNFDYDQLILEWFGRNPWIHISTNSTGHRKSVLTQVSSSSYSPGLRLLG